LNKGHRYEIKFILDNAKLSEIYQWIKDSTFMKKSFPDRKVNSLYFDDENYSCVRDNLAGISDRKKMRLRWYGQKEGSCNPSFEIKYRQGRLGWKESHSIGALEGVLMDLNLEEIQLQCENELIRKKVILDTHLFPTLQTVYDREYYVDPEGIRLTVDKNIKFYNSLLYRKLNQDLETNYPLQVMEIKFSPSLKDKVAALIQSFHMTPKRHSKYLVGISALGFSVYL
tara:strand:- start:162 stop:842 length:681 start_codon:yes stop_codon:yes gene_type:complete